MLNVASKHGVLTYLSKIFDKLCSMKTIPWLCVIFLVQLSENWLALSAAKNDVQKEVARPNYVVGVVDHFCVLGLLPMPPALKCLKH